MNQRDEAYLLGFLYGARKPGSAIIHHRDREVMEEAARFLQLACAHRKIPHVRLHHPERPLNGTLDENILTLPSEIIQEIDLPLPALFKRFSAFLPDVHRGILEGCGTLCYKKESRRIGISFTSTDPTWLEELHAEVGREYPCGPVQKSERGSYWFGIADASTRAYATWLYHDPQAPHSKARRRKLRQVLGQLSELRSGEMAPEENSLSEKGSTGKG